MIKRRKTRTVKVGKVKIGSGHPVSVQSMAKTDTVNIRGTTAQIRELEAAGCEIVRVAVKTPEAARAIKEIKKEISIPIVADIHFDPALAIESVVAGADKIRLNPGNMKDAGGINDVIAACRDRGLPIRIGANSGSLTEMARGKGSPAKAMVSALIKYIEPFRRKRFGDIVISLKASDVMTTVDAYRIMARECDYPFHVGVTATGLPEDGIVSSSIGIGALLLDGIGDTIRVSLTGDPIQEIPAARRILSSAGVRSFGHRVIACPTCGRCRVDLAEITAHLKKELESIQRSDERAQGSGGRGLLIAVMGCEVNGPGEAKSADMGVAFGKDKGAIFSHGRIIKTVKSKDAVRELVKMVVSEQ